MLGRRIDEHRGSIVGGTSGWYIARLLASLLLVMWRRGGSSGACGAVSEGLT